MNRSGGRAARIVHFAVLALVSAFILSIFIRPTSYHAGINTFPKSIFQDMVDGTAYRPFVYRTLVPTTLRTISALTPDRVEEGAAALAESNALLIAAFEHLNWNASSAYLFFWLVLIMLSSFVGFAHVTSRLSLEFCDIPDTFVSSTALGVVALLGLPPFFKFVSYIYDPTQLFLFTLALWYLARTRTTAFLVTFGFCCLSKETAILLIPLYALTNLRRSSIDRRSITILFGMTSYFLIVKSFLTYVYRDNPGLFVTFHLNTHNFKWLTDGWDFLDVLVIATLLTFLVYRWKDKPKFVTDSFVCTLIPLLGLGLFLGYVDEWRGYYEAYALGFVLILDSALRFRKALDTSGVSHST